MLAPAAFGSGWHFTIPKKEKQQQKEKKKKRSPPCVRPQHPVE